MEEIYVIIRTIGSYEDVEDTCYWYWEEARLASKKLQDEYHAKGYTDFIFDVKSIKIKGLK